MEITDKQRNNKILNQFKCKIYGWEMSQVLKYYKNDSFCIDYCIAKNDSKYGCTKRKSDHDNKNKCEFEHSEKFNLHNLINDKEYCDWDLAKVLCLYITYVHKNSSKYNPAIFDHYGGMLQALSGEEEEYLEAEKYLIKAISIDDSYARAHNSYAKLLNHELENSDKAEFHYKRALELDPNDATANYNFALFLKDKQSKYDESLFYCQTACQLDEKENAHHQELRGQLLYQLNHFDEAIDVLLHAVKLFENEGNKIESRIKAQKRLIGQSTEKYIECDLKLKNYLKFKGSIRYDLMRLMYDNQLLQFKRQILSKKLTYGTLKNLSQDEIFHNIYPST